MNRDPLEIADLVKLEEWRSPVLDAIYSRSLDECRSFLGPDVNGSLPARDRIFSALNTLRPVDVRCVIFGQDPYPRRESANGIAFSDEAVKKWSQPLSPSLRNIIKNVLMFEGLVLSSSNVSSVRKAIEDAGLVQPPEWFRGTMNQGVLWLNTALTFTSSDPSVLCRHTSFWRPVIVSIIRTLLTVKADCKTGNSDGLVFVFWGGHARKLRPVVEGISSEISGVRVGCVDAPHPAVQQFHTVNSFELIAAALDDLGSPQIDWLLTERRK